MTSQWRLVRLELGHTPEFPSGSASRAYILRLPLDASGVIDSEAIERRPNVATVRRFWPNEPDRQGHLVRTSKGWAFSYALRGDGDEEPCHFEPSPVRQGACLTLTEPDGNRLPFKVVHTGADETPLP